MAHVRVQSKAGDGGLTVDVDVALEGLADVDALADALDRLRGDVEAWFVASVGARFVAHLGVRLEEPA